MGQSEQGERCEDIDLELLLFELFEQCFAIAACDAIEVARATALRPLPNAPAIVEGIVDWRGELVPVLDIRARFGLPKKPLELGDHFVLGRSQRRLVALRVDRVLEIARLTAVRLERAPHLPRGVRNISGLASRAGSIILLHDLPSFLSEAEAGAIDGALQADAALERSA